MRKKHYLLFSSLGFLMAALLTLCVSLADFQLSEINKYDVTRYTQRLHKQQKDIYDIIAHFNPQDIHTLLSSNLSNNVAFFIFKNEKLLHWIHDAPIDERQLLQIDTISRFVKLNHNWYITRSFYKDDYRIVVTVAIKHDHVYVDQPHNNNVNAVFSIADNIIIGPPLDDHGIIVYGIEGYPVMNLYTYDQEARQDIVLLLRWMSVLFLLISIFLLFQYLGRYKTV
ncbi:MAG: hypothetical protein LBF39_00965, partial [Prevotellaceae bacterium]|nr:hypothetical protein [Prevotellaceae bacterium]